MQLEQVKEAIASTPKGANVILEWVRPCKVKKSCQDNLTKSVRMVGRVGIEYDNQKAVEAKRESGELPAENAGLPWGEWIEYPWLIGHKGQTYLRLYKGTSDKVHPEVHFFKNGVEIAVSEIENDLLASEKTEKQGDCFTCKTENVTRIHTESEWMMVMVKQVDQEKVAVNVPVPARVLATM